MASVIIPAHNEARSIERCLDSILAGSKPGEFEIFVVCNACTDQTAERARQYADRGVLVLESELASKTKAMNLGDAHATRFPRFYVDADIKVSCQALREVVGLFDLNPAILLAAPRAIVDFQERGVLVQSFYKVWTQLPYVREGVGVGIFAFSKAGRSSFGDFPETFADDTFARLQVRPDQRTAAKSSFQISPPTSAREIVKIFSRMHTANYQLYRQFPELQANRSTNSARSLRVIAETPRLWLHAPVYLGLMGLSKLRARRRARSGEQQIWARDESARDLHGDGRE